MEDYFARLGVPRRVWLDEEELKARFLKLSSQAHPDRVHGEGSEAREAADAEFSTLNAAYNCLRQSRSRVLHFLELAGCGKPGQIQSVPAAAIELFAPVAEVNKGTEQFLREKSKAASPMLKVRFFQEGLGWTDRIQTLLGEIQVKVRSIEDRLKQIDSEISKEVDGPRALSHEKGQELSELAATLGFLGKWQAQLQERLAALAF